MQPSLADVMLAYVAGIALATPIPPDVPPEDQPHTTTHDVLPPSDEGPIWGNRYKDTNQRLNCNN